MDKILEYLSNNRSRVAIVIAPFVSVIEAAFAKALVQYLGLSAQDATVAAGILVVGTLVHFGIYVKKNGEYEQTELSADKAEAQAVAVAAAEAAAKSRKKR